MRKAIILAAGKGTRMKSDTFKVLHPIGNRSMIGHLLDTLKQVQVDETVVVLAPDMDAVKREIAPIPFVIQKEALGTAHAVLAAKDYIQPFDGACLVLFGDHPLFYPETFQKMLDKCENGADVVVLGFTPADPARYGRLIMGADGLDAIVEYKDATDEQRKIGLCNSGAMCINGRCLYDLLKQIDNNNVAKEYYLPDIVKVAKKQGLKVDVGMADAEEVAGANSRHELSLVEAVFQKRMRQKAFESGVTMQDPNSVYFSYDTTFENDIFIEPGVYFGPGVHIKKGARIPAFTRIENKTIERK
ncbi:MAG: NTP transferase domain-containing protein [Alphaproteobacteria bacterium]|nr:NTP transferase domain-containing protein [Alphaproteobacteria bacterium]